MLLLMIFQVILHIILILLFHCPSCRGERSFTVWWPLVGRTSCGVLWCISCSRTSHHRVMKHLQHGSADVERSASPKEILLPFLCRASVFWCQYIYCQCGHKVFVSVHSVHFCSVNLSLTEFGWVTCFLKSTSSSFCLCDADFQVIQFTSVRKTLSTTLLYSAWWMIYISSSYWGDNITSLDLRSAESWGQY